MGDPTSSINREGVSSSGCFPSLFQAKTPDPDKAAAAKLKEQLTVIHKEAMKLQKGMRTPTKQLAKLAVTVPDSTKLGTLSSAIETKKQSIENLKSRLQTLDTQVPNQKLAEQILSIQSELTELKATLTYQEETITNLRADLATFSKFATGKKTGNSDTQRPTLSTLMATVNKATKNLRQGVSKPRLLHSPPFRGDLNDRMQAIGQQIAACKETLSSAATVIQQAHTNKAWTKRAFLDYRKHAYGVAEKLNALRVKHEAFTTVFDDPTRIVLATPALVSDKLEGLNKENAHIQINLALDELDKGEAALRQIPEGTARYIIAVKALQAAEQEIIAKSSKYPAHDPTRIALATPAFVSDKLKGLNKENSHTKINLALDELYSGEAALRQISEGTARYIIAANALRAAEKKIAAKGREHLAQYFDALNNAKHYRKSRPPVDFFAKVGNEPNSYIQVFSLLIAHDRLTGEGTFTLQWETLSPELKNKLMEADNQFKELANLHIAQTANKKWRLAIASAKEAIEVQKIATFYDVARKQVETIPNDPKFTNQYNEAVSELDSLYQKLNELVTGLTKPPMKRS